MRRREPPSPANWMLEHLTSGERDDALAGDLLEEYSGGRPDGWYWRQALAACAVSWVRSLQARLPLLFFAFLWSMLAPAWKVFCDQVQNSKALADAWGVLGGIWVFPALAVWVILHAAFLWAGILVYAACRTSLGSVFQKGAVRRALILSPLIFTPLYGAIVMLASLYWWSVPGLNGQKLGSTVFAQITDLRLLADAVRFPFLMALLCALWGAIPLSTRSSRIHAAESAEIGTPTQSNALLSALDPFTLKRFFGLMVGAGLMNALIGGFLLCRLPEAHAPSIGSLAIRAVAYVALGALAGIGGTWLYWKNQSSPFVASAPLPFRLFALICATGWVWVPSMVIFAEEISPAAAFVAMIGAFVLASGLRNATNFIFAPAALPVSVSGNDGSELFAESLFRPRAEAHGYVIALCFYAAGAALVAHAIYTATALLALSASLFAWKRTTAGSLPPMPGHELRQAASRLACGAFLAVLVTMWALLDGVAHRNQAAQASGTVAASGDSVNGAPHRKSETKAASHGLGGYESVILWPYAEKSQIVAPIPMEDSLLGPGVTRPVTIRFDGVYRYVQPPDKVPGPTAHHTRGSPVSMDIESNDSVPVVMDADQNLPGAIRIARCREIEVEVENYDNRAGPISLALLLTDGASPQGRTLNLGERPVVSTEPGHFSMKQSPVLETLRFPVPEAGRIRKFSEITVQVIPDIEHSFVAPKIGIVQFQFFPR